MDIGAVGKPIVGAVDNVVGGVHDIARSNPFGLSTLVFDDVDVAARRVEDEPRDGPRRGDRQQAGER